MDETNLAINLGELTKHVFIEKDVHNNGYNRMQDYCITKIKLNYAA